MKPIKILFYPNKAKKSVKTNLTPIYMRIAKGSVKVEAKIENIGLRPDEINSWDEMTQRLLLKDNTVNKKLEEISEDFRGLRYIYKSDYETFSPVEIKAKLFGSKLDRNPNDIITLEYIEKVYNDVILPNNNTAHGTKINYRKGINHLINYLSYKKQTKATLLNLAHSHTFGLDFFEYLQNTIPEIKKKGMTDTSASNILKVIKYFFKRAKTTKLTNVNPFEEIKRVRKCPKKNELTTNEIRLLMNLDLSDDTSLNVYRDLFLFQVFTGLSNIDIYELKDHEIYHERGEIMYVSSREKTEIKTKQILVKQAVDIIHKYKSHWDVGIKGNILPQRSYSNIRRNLKLISAMAGIHKKVTTHIARHTCTQMLTDIGYINADVINTMLGWSSGKEGTRVKYRNTSFEALLHAKKLFQEFIDNTIITK